LGQGRSWTALFLWVEPGGVDVLAADEGFHGGGVGAFKVELAVEVFEFTPYVVKQAGAAFVGVEPDPPQPPPAAVAFEAGGACGDGNVAMNLVLVIRVACESGSNGAKSKPSWQRT
jgi:hypothetical protein